MFRLYTFIGMLIQVPLIVLTRLIYKRLRNPVYGNVVFWLVFVIFGK